MPPGLSWCVGNGVLRSRHVGNVGNRGSRVACILEQGKISLCDIPSEGKWSSDDKNSGFEIFGL